MMTISITRSIRAGASALAIALSLAATATAQDRTYSIPAEPLSSSLREFARVSGEQIVFTDDLVRGKSAPALQGSFPADEALARILAGTGLVARRSDNGTIMIVRADSPQDQAAVQSSDGGVARVEDIVVTGTRIRGANPTVPVRVVTRDEINRSGYGSIGEVMRSLPENFNGGQNPGVIAASGSNNENQNITNASSINLRGIGSSGTLTLLNGRRLPSDGYFQASDISGIPLVAVSRVEVVTDGASALYGSDAIAGVANIILRRDFTGAEAKARFGGATQGGGWEETYGLSGGLARDNWYAMLSLERATQDGMKARDRDYLSAAVQDVDIIRPSESTSAYFGAGFDLSDRASFTIDALANESSYSVIQQLRPTSARANAEADKSTHTISAGLDLKLSGDWMISVAGVTGESEHKRVSTTVTSRSELIYKNESNYVETTLTGTAFELPSGRVRLAMGGGYREESFDRIGSSPQSANRDISYVFAETLIPLVAKSADRSGLNELELSASVRSEDYSDFGSTTNPKIGIRYVPFQDLTLRGTWGTSFRAPTLNQTSSAVYTYFNAATGNGGAAGQYAFTVTGGDPHLLPEEADTWSLGFDYRSRARDIIISGTYFGIDYDGRIAIPISTTSTALSNPNFAPFITIAPSADILSDLIAQGIFTNNAGIPYSPGAVSVLIDNRYRNVARQTIEGFDLSIRKAVDVETGSLDIFTNASWLRSRQQTLATLPEFDLSGTIFNPPEWRVRGGATWVVGDVTATGIVNFQTGNTDTGATPNRKIASLTTVDANLAYDFPQEAGPLAGVRVALSATNLFDLDPPYAASPAVSQTGIYFDSTNSSPIGRFVALTLSKRW